MAVAEEEQIKRAYRSVAEAKVKCEREEWHLCADALEGIMWTFENIYPELVEEFRRIRREIER